jgi:hypothetical protein
MCSSSSFSFDEFGVYGNYIRRRGPLDRLVETVKEGPDPGVDLVDIEPDAIDGRKQLREGT